VGGAGAVDCFARTGRPLQRLCWRRGGCRRRRQAAGWLAGEANNGRNSNYKTSRSDWSKLGD